MDGIEFSFLTKLDCSMTCVPLSVKRQSSLGGTNEIVVQLNSCGRVGSVSRVGPTEVEITLSVRVFVRVESSRAGGPNGFPVC